MENASKALIMAASVLLGIMIISVGVALFTSFSEFSRNTLEKVEESKISEWNNNYLKYYGNVTVIENGREKITPILVTAHEIISVANHAKQNNINYELENQARYDENNYYVQVKVDGIYNFEKQTESEQNQFLKDNTLTVDNQVKYYTCTNVIISKITKRVIYIEFKEE